MSRKAKIVFSDKYHPLLCIISSIIAGLTIAILLTLFIISVAHHGVAGLYAGFIGILCLVANIIGCFLAFPYLTKDNVYRTYPLLGMIGNGLMAFSYVVLYVVGSF